MLLALLLILAILAFGFGFVVKWLFIAAVVLVLLAIVESVGGGLFGRGRY